MCIDTCMLSRVHLFATPWTVAQRVSLFMEFSRQEYWSKLPFPPPEDLPNPGIKPTSSASPALTGGLFTTVHVCVCVCVYTYIYTHTHSCQFILLVNFKLISLAKGRFTFTSALLYQYLFLIIACVPRTSEDQVTV